jgi:NAD(P)-dependent dehydrogenase (short-subunit alcohol dehydrogenase family)
MQSLNQKKCLITGAASGIGRATAIAAAKEGAHLVLTDVNERLLEDTVRQIRTAGGTVTSHRALDISDFEAVQSFASAVHDEHGSMDVVMNIAGISVWGAIENMDHAHWSKVIAVNLMGPIHVIECFLPEMIRARRGGHLVNVSSAAGLLGLPWHAAYSATKFGLRGISEVLRFDLERHGIGVSLVCPGAVDTPLVNTVEILGVDRNRPELARHAEKFRRRAATPEQAADAILRGIHRNDYLVFTSRDIKIAHWLQQLLPSLYEAQMRALNRHWHRVAEGGRRSNAGGVLRAEAR